jgi:type I restriction enzyme R subunit
VALIRAYAGISDEMDEAGYSQKDCDRIAKEVKGYLDLREVIRKASGESIDLKAYEADMRHLIDTYIETSSPRTISPFEGMPLIEIIVKTGIAEAIATELSELKGHEEAVAETIENNVRKKIIKEHLTDPAFYDRISVLLDEIIKARKEKALEYEEYLKQIAELTKRVVQGREENLPEPLKQSPALRALYNNLQKFQNGNESARTAEIPDSLDGDPMLQLAIRLHEAIKTHAPADFRGHVAKERAVKRAMYEVLMDQDEVERLFPIIKSQREY